MTRTAVFTMLAMLAAAGCNHPCNPDNCAEGCCDPDGVCLVNGGNDACGLAAASCQRCDSEHLCSSAGQCAVRPHEISESCKTEDDCKAGLVCFRAPEQAEGRCQACGRRGDACVPGSCCFDPSGAHYTCEYDNSKVCVLR